MLLINQRLDKLAAMRCDFAKRGMLPGGHTANPSTLQGPEHLNLPSGNNDEDEDEGPVEEDILGHVVLARNRGMSCIRTYPHSF